MSAEKLVTIDDAIAVTLNLGASKDTEVRNAIRNSRKIHWAVAPNDVIAAFCLIVNRASVDPEVKERFQEIFKVPFGWTSLRDEAFGGFNIDPRRADLLDTEG